MTRPQTPSDRKQQSHDRIVEAAARAVREHGYAGVGVAEVMREAGLTHGGFYAHFPSRDALLVAALEHAGRHSAASIAARADASRLRGETAFRALVEGYLHDGLLAARDAGCPVAALCADMPRQTGDVRKASTSRLRALVRYVERCLPAGTPPDEAAVVAATLIGGLQMARALGANAEGEALLASTRRTLLARYDRP